MLIVDIVCTKTCNLFFNLSLFQRIDFDSMEIAGPYETPATATWLDGLNVGKCNTDTLSG